MIRFIKRDTELSEVEALQIDKAREDVKRYGFEVYRVDINKLADTFNPEHNYLLGVIGKHDIDSEITFTGYRFSTREDVLIMERGYNNIFRNGVNFYIAIHKDERVM